MNGKQEPLDWRNRLEKPLKIKTERFVPTLPLSSQCHYTTVTIMSNAEFDIGETLRKRLEEISAKKNSIGVSRILEKLFFGPCSMSRWYF
jgi:hypothetical protein